MTPPTLTRTLTLVLAASVGVLAANLYYAQPLAVAMASSLGLAVANAGLVVTITQVGYGFGVLFLVPLGDLAENRRVILSLVGLTFLSLLAVGLAPSLAFYYLAAFALGVGASCVQLIVPYATHLAPTEIRGQVVGSLMSGLMMGIMLSRPIAGIVSEYFSWHGVYFLSAAMMAGIGVVLVLRLPPRRPLTEGVRYPQLIVSMLKLHFQYSVLRRRAIYQACMFGAFCLFWTASPILLAGPRFHLSPTGIAIFAFVGVAGAVFAPIAGKLADRGFTSLTSAFSFFVGSISFALTQLVPLGSTFSLGLLVVSAILLDAGVSGNLVLGQRAIFGLAPELRGRLNSLYVATIFVGGSIGSFLGAWAYAHGGWSLAAWIGMALPCAGFIYFLTEFAGARRVLRA